MKHLISLVFFLCCATAALAQDRCQGTVACALGDRSYHILPPDDWDGETALPVLLHFHGWARQGDVVVTHQRIAGATRRRGVLLVAPNGDRRTWNFWRAGTGDVGFASAVLRDVMDRYPVDTDRVYVSGYSYGSAMAWRYVCEAGAGVAALLAVAGTLPQTETCAQAPRVVRHVHGLADTVMDFPEGPGGDRTYPVALWRDRLGCGSGKDQGPWQARDWLTFQRTHWADCSEGTVTLDLHPGGHFIPHGWIARQLDQLMGLPYSYP